MKVGSHKALLQACKEQGVSCTIHFRISGVTPLHKATVEEITPASGADAYVHVSVPVHNGSVSVYFNTADVYRVDVDWAKAGERSNPPRGPGSASVP